MAGPRTPKENTEETKTASQTGLVKKPQEHIVRLTKNYRPQVGLKFQVAEEIKDENGEPALKYRDPIGSQEIVTDGLITKAATDDYKKLQKNSLVVLPRAEAKRLVNAKLGTVEIDW